MLAVSCAGKDPATINGLSTDYAKSCLRVARVDDFRSESFLLTHTVTYKLELRNQHERARFSPQLAPYGLPSDCPFSDRPFCCVGQACRFLLASQRKGLYPKPWNLAETFLAPTTLKGPLTLRGFLGPSFTRVLSAPLLKFTF